MGLVGVGLHAWHFDLSNMHMQRSFSQSQILSIKESRLQALVDKDILGGRA